MTVRVEVTGKDPVTGQPDDGQLTVVFDPGDEGAKTATVINEQDETVRGSATFTVPFPIDRPPAPTGLDVTDVTEETATVSWSYGEDDVDGFEVRYRVSGETEWEIVDVPNESSRSQQLTGLTPGTEYETTVLAYVGSDDDRVYSAQPDPVTFTTSSEGPQIIVDKTSVDSTGDAAERTISVDGVGFGPELNVSLSLRTGAPGSGGTEVATGSATSDAEGMFIGAEVVVPQNEEAGDYHMTANDGVLTSDDTAITVTGGGGQLATPTGLAAGTVTDTTVPLQWDAVADAAVYVVRWAPEADPENWTERGPVADTFDTVGDLTAGTEYRFEVKAQGVDHQDSEWSDPVNATTSGG